MAGSPNLVMLGIQAEPARAAELARELARMRELSCVVLLLGRYSILAMGLFTSIEQLNQLIAEQIRPLDGVLDVESSISVHNVKYEVGVARITPESPA
jgi:Lrp/AsnC family transcriptional regulator, regulator for asnA, asnC and gidA